jgi:bla regulator protein blaR1
MNPLWQGLAHAVGLALWQSLWVGFFVAVLFRFLRVWLAGHPRFLYGFAITGLFFCLLQFLLNVASPTDVIASLEPAKQIFSNTQNAQTLTITGETPSVLANPALSQATALTTAAAAIWMLGLFVQILILFFGQRQLRTMLAAAQPVPALDLALQTLAQRFGCHPSIRVLQSAIAQVPLVLGTLKPVIILPSSVLLQMSPTQLEMILMHELVHVRRCDYLVNWLQIVAESVFFFHPALIWLGREIRRLREEICDDQVIAFGAARLEYARMLVGLEERRTGSIRLAPSAAAGALTQRIERIILPTLNGSGVNLRHQVRWAAATVLLALVIALSLPKLQPVVEFLSLQGKTRVLRPQVAISAQSRLTASLNLFQPRIIASTASSLTLSVTDQTQSLNDGSAPLPAGEFVTDVPQAPAIALQEVSKALQMQTQTSHSPLVDPRVMLSIGRPNLFADSALQGSQWVTTQNSANDPISVWRRVLPRYPDGIARRSVRIRLEFSVNDQGRVQGMTAIEGANERSFVDASTSALSQWRFDPLAAQQSLGTHFIQTFEFIQPVHDDSDLDAAAPGLKCVTKTGSHHCRPLK